MRCSVESCDHSQPSLQSARKAPPKVTTQYMVGHRASRNFSRVDLRWSDNYNSYTHINDSFIRFLHLTVPPSLCLHPRPSSPTYTVTSRLRDCAAIPRSPTIIFLERATTHQDFMPEQHVGRINCTSGSSSSTANAVKPVSVGPERDVPDGSSTELGRGDAPGSATGVQKPGTGAVSGRVGVDEVEEEMKQKRSSSGDGVPSLEPTASATATLSKLELPLSVPPTAAGGTSTAEQLPIDGLHEATPNSDLNDRNNRNDRNDRNDRPDPPHPLNPLGLHLLTHPTRGRGVFTPHALPAGTLIEESPVLLLTKQQWDEGNMDGTVLGEYGFCWSNGGMGIGLGIGE